MTDRHVSPEDWGMLVLEEVFLRAAEQLSRTGPAREVEIAIDVRMSVAEDGDAIDVTAPQFGGESVTTTVTQPH